MAVVEDAGAPLWAVSRSPEPRYGVFEVSLRGGGQEAQQLLRCFGGWGKPVPCLPMVWVYGSQAAMPMAVPLALLELAAPNMDSFMDLLAAETSVIEYLARRLEACRQAGPLSVSVMVHTAPERAPSQKASYELIGEEAWDEVNISHHTWIWPDLEARMAEDPSISLTTTVEFGIFAASGVEPCHQDLACELSRGAAFGALGQREVIVHDGGRFSPCNCMLRLLPDAVFHHFFSVSCHPDAGAAVVLHVVPAHAEGAQRVLSLALAADSLPDFLAAMTALDMAGGGRKILRVVEACCGPGVEAEVAPRAAKITKELSALPPLDPWQPPTAQDRGAVVDGEEVLKLANQLMDMGYPDFDFNMEVLQATGGDLAAALEILGPASAA